MRLRKVLSGALAATCGVMPAQLPAQEAPAKRLAAIVGVAVEEYGKGVDPSGKIISAVELDEANGFLREAKEAAKRLVIANADKARALLDSLIKAASRRATPAELAIISHRFVAELGIDGALDLPSRPVDLARGQEIFVRSCAQCHGATGAGDGSAARNIVPPPAPIGTKATMNAVSPAYMYRLVSVGVSGTMMAAWASQLTPDERWAVVGYVNSLRSTDADRNAGRALLKAGCASCAGPTPPAAIGFAWQAERSDSAIAAAVRAGDAATGVARGSLASAVEVDKVVAALRAGAVVAPSSGTATVAATADGTDPRSAARQAVRRIDDALAAARAGHPAEAGDLAFDAYIAFEPLEGPARMRNPGLVAAMERHFADFKGAVKANDATAAESARNSIEQGIPTILELSTAIPTWWGAFLESFIIIVREGFEAILVLGAVVAFLIKTGNRSRLRDIWWGAGAGLVASAVLAVLMRTALSSMPVSQELIEGVTLLVAVFVLFSVSYWLISKVEGEKWQKFIRAKVSTALSNGGGLALGLVAFLAVFREGAETALFYQALFARGGNVLAPVTIGLVAGFGALIVIFTLFYRFGVRIPLRWFFTVTSGLLYYMAMAFAGKGVMELQEANVFSRTLIPSFPQIDLLGIYPTVESLMAQGVLLSLLLFALWRTLSPASGDDVEPTGRDVMPPEVAARFAELQVTARRLQDRVDSLEKEIEHETKTL